MLPAGDQDEVELVPPHPGLYTTSCKHSLALLRMGEIIAETCYFNKIIIVASSWLFILLIQLHLL